ncbi:DUF4965 domain-containing protein [Paludibacter sp.]
MKKIVLIFLSSLILSSCFYKEELRVNSSLRAPAYPLINIDTYTNAWLFGDTLYQSQPSHWTGKAFPLLGALRVDGEVYRFMGVESNYIKPIIRMGEVEPLIVKYTNVKPENDWKSIDYNDKDWNEGNAPFGKRMQSIINTVWESENLWVRKEFYLEDELFGKKIFIEYSNDDEVEIYINGVEVVRVYDKCENNIVFEVDNNDLALLRKGKNIISVYCHNKGGDAYLDFGLSIEESVKTCLDKTAVQKSVSVLPTQTIFNFACGAVDLKLTFTAPLLMNNLELLSRPVNYISYEVESNDEQAHEVEIYLEASPVWALNTRNQLSENKVIKKDKQILLRTGSTSQQVLGKQGDDVRIDWGYFYLGSEMNGTESGIGHSYDLRKLFKERGSLKEFENSNEIKTVQKRLALSKNIGNIKRNENGFFMLGYDDIFSIQYFGINLRPYWNRNRDKDIYDQFKSAQANYEKIISACNKFDNELMEEAKRCGGVEYAELCALAYRQSVSAHKLVLAPNGDLLFLSKENYSSGSIATVDVTYPSAPLFLLYNVELLKGMLNPIFYYVESGRWQYPFAPHDIGIYPIANGQMNSIFMPVEESGNMLILTTAIATMEGNAQYAEKHWEALSSWADFLVDKGFDPEYQSNTDIFAGHSAHNANLSIKAILGIACYGRLADMLGHNETARKYATLARNMALDWVKKADDGDHYRFAFDQPNTWSQKYNLVWDKIMKINAFPHEVPEKEIAYYLTKQNIYGLPLDSRHQYSKADWIVWSATLSRSTDDFQKLINPLYRFVNETTDRIPMSDWYWTDRPEHVAFRARSVLGGYFIKMMEDKLISKPNLK